MSAKGDGGDFDGTIGRPQMRIDFDGEASRTEATKPKPTYEPSPKHDPVRHWDGASINPIRSHKEGQHLLETGFKLGKQVYNITEHGEIVKFQPTNTPKNEYHSYGAEEKQSLPTPVLRWLRDRGAISRGEYTKLVNNKQRRRKS